MSTNRSDERNPRVTFTISQEMDDQQVAIARALGLDEPTAAVQRDIYQAGIEAKLAGDSQVQLLKTQIKLLEEILESLRSGK